MAERHVNYAASVAEDVTAEPAPRTSAGGAGFQVSLQTLIWIISLAAFLLAALYAFPPVLSAIVALLLSVCIPAALVSCIVFGRSAWRAFGLGALLPSVLRLFTVGPFGLASRAGVETQMQMIREAQGIGRYQGGSFDIHTQLIDLWHKTGSTMMADECIFWGTSAVAGVAAVLVQQRFARANALRSGGPPRRG